MPREIVHWSVLAEVEAQLEEAGETALVNCLKHYRAAAALGAMTHDAAYYLKFGGQPFEAAAEMLHGKEGEDTFVPLRKMAQEILKHPPADRSPLWAFLLGMCTHHVTDIIFHPFIYFFTGNYYATEADERHHARARHRLLEVYLDSYFEPESRLWSGGKYTAVLSELGDINPICLLLAVIAPKVQEPQDSAKLWRDSIWYMANFQRLFISTTVGGLVRVTNLLTGDKIVDIDALFALGRHGRREALKQKFNYQNPITGDVRSLSVKELFDQSVKECRELILRFKPLLIGEARDAEAVLGDIRGRSLNFGIVGGHIKDAKYFSSEGINLPGLEIQR